MPDRFGRQCGSVLRTAVGAALLIVGSAGMAAAADDEMDMPLVLKMVNESLETQKSNVEIPWSNADTGHRGVIVVERTFYPTPDTPCRDYRRTLERPGQPTEVTKGTGCRIGPGRWKLEEQRSAATSPPSPPPTGSGRASQPSSTSPSKSSKKTTPAEATCPPVPACPKGDKAASGSVKAVEPPPPALPPFTLPSKAEL